MSDQLSINFGPEEKIQPYENLLETFPDELETEKEGGVIIIPWHRTQNGYFLSRWLEVECLARAKEIREKHEQ